MISIDKKFEGNSINVVFAADNKYAYYMAVALQSLIEHANDEKNYDIIIFGTEINAELQNQISGMQKPNISIRFVDSKDIFSGFDTEKLFCHLYFSKEMYLRLFIPDVLKDYDKALYIDCDTIIEADVAEIFDCDIDDYYLAAVKDYNSIVNHRHYPNVQLYFDEVIKVPDINQYFNSGVLLMNLNVLREIKLVEKTVELLKKHKELLYPDQDILNLICAGNVKIIHNGWNFVFAINAALVHDNHFIQLAVEWAKGLADQKIIHFISEKKPWDTPQMSYADIWWKYAKHTPVYQKLLKDYFDKHPEHLK